ncbi:MAG: DEAD/DEAH box helicase family protein [Cardiobacterium sp.]
MATFHDHLIINRWLLSLFNQHDLQAFKTRLGDDRFSGLDESGQTRFFEQLNNSLFHSDAIDEQTLRRYDFNIVRHWQQITAKRNHAEGHELQLKYFQYLSLLFTEIYLDWYFNRRNGLCDALNQTLAQYLQERDARNLSPYGIEDLNKLAYWNATGSGKTLLMHVNILQFRHYCPAKMDKTILLTPNEGLSLQHLKEFHASGLRAVIFDKNRSSSDLFGDIEIIDINKLAERDGDKTVAVAAFAGRNLVLVDEGHRGTSGDAWMKRRAALIGDGFAFEYSATFGQAVAKEKTIKEQEIEIIKKKAETWFRTKSLKKLDEEQLKFLELNPAEQRAAKQTAMFETYAKAVLFDYSYKYFYADGYGKESLILNMDDAGYALHSDLYLTACLLSFYQQLYLFDTGGARLDEWNLERPLWVFVGNKVADDDSDVLQVVRFLAFFLNQAEKVQRWLHALLEDKAQIVDKHGNNIFSQRFAPLMAFLGKEADLYADILQSLFHAPAGGRLHLSLLKKVEGELALAVGENGTPFAVINIGDASGFFKTAEGSEDFVCRSDDFSPGLFAKINQKDSPIHLLIGSRKFSEGWSSWRVSTMGLLNMGKSEGSQIIQLFGRGVRLKGRGFSLKRSLAAERPKGLHLDKLETLNIFGIRAGYMEQFKAYLREEGITPPDEMLVVDFKVQPNLPTVKLKTLKLKNLYKDDREKSFKNSVFLDFPEIPEELRGGHKKIYATLDRYPRVETLTTTPENSLLLNQRKKNKLNKDLFPLFDWDAIYLQLLDFKQQSTWRNLRLNKERLRVFAEGNDWYTLFIPENALTVHSFDDIRKQQGLLLELLRLYIKDYYLYMKRMYESKHYEIVPVNDNDDSMEISYEFTIEPNDIGRNYEEKLLKLKKAVESDSIKKALNWRAPQISAICFPAHLYYPIMVLEDKDSLPLKMQPLNMNVDSEIRFVHKLQEAYKSGDLLRWTGGRDLYLLRNADNKRNGLGFALAGNFYPDFLLWLVDRDSGRQWLSLIDPKGIRQMDLGDPKFGLADEVKRLQRELKLDICLNSFILSVTARQDLLNVADWTDEDFREKHILFMDDDYLPEMFAMILDEGEMV